MFKINLAKLSDFDTQVLTLINLSPGSWSLGSHPTLVCHHKDLGWFHRSWIFGVQPMLHVGGGGYNRLRRLTWRGQILLRRAVREIKRSAIDLNSDPIAVAAPGGAIRPTGGGPLSANMFATATQAALDASGLRGAMLGMAALPRQSMLSSAPGVRAPTATMGGHACDDLLRRGADPALTSAAFKGDVAAQGVLLDWIKKHM